MEILWRLLTILTKCDILVLCTGGRVSILRCDWIAGRSERSELAKRDAMLSDAMLK